MQLVPGTYTFTGHTRRSGSPGYKCPVQGPVAVPARPNISQGLPQRVNVACDDVASD
jgi:hypothetical protein